MLNVRNILVPVDFSEASGQALEWAIKILEGVKEASIGLCHVVPAVSPVGPDAMTFDYWRIERKAALEKLAHWQRTIPEPIESYTVIGHGDVAQEVARLSQSKKVDLVVTTTHARRGVSRILHGNAAEEMVRLASCPVLVLHLHQGVPASVAA